MKNNFIKSCGIGNFGENIVIDFFTKNGFIVTKNPDHKSIEWDILLIYDNKEYKLEIKLDAMENKTGNIALEYFNTKKCSNSGILATSSDFWIFVLQNPLTVWISKTSNLLKYFHEAKPFKSIANGGDNNSAMKLYKRDDILSAVFTKINDLNYEEFIKVLNE